MQSILNDPNISLFMEKIPEKQKLITLKELIYIGIKIVTNSFQTQNQYQFNQNNQYHKKTNHNKQQLSQEKENKTSNFNKINQGSLLRQNKNKSQANLKKQKQYDENYQTKTRNQNKKVQSTLLREISKIRMQLQNLTNKVYDHCFESNHSYQNFNGYSQQLNVDNYDQIQKYGFNGQDIPTFSPPKDNQVNPFMKQKNNFLPHETQQQNSFKNKDNNNKQTKSKQNQKHTNVMHLDDTQIRQALHQSNQNDFEQNRDQKSRSMIQKRHQIKKKSQQKYFNDLAIDKKRVQELNRIKKSKSTLEPYQKYQRYEKDNQYTIKQMNNPYRKKAKSKIKKLVEKDRLRYQQKMKEYQFQKGFEQYEYSANQLEDDEQNQQQSQNGHQQQSKRFNKSPQKQDFKYSSQNYESSNRQPSNIPSNNPSNTPSNVHFGFYESRQPQQDNTFSNNQAFNQEQDQINIGSDSSSFSQFSMSSHSRREVGKISRRRQD